MKKNTFFSDLLSVFTSRATVLVLGLLNSIITARYLGPEGNGIIAAVSVYPNLFMTIGALGIQQSTTYFVGQEKYELNEVYGAVLAIFIFTSTVVVTACYFLIEDFTKSTYSNILILWAVAAIPFSLYTTYSSGIFLGKQKIKQYNRINWIPSVINLVFTFVFIAVFPFGAAGSMAGTFLGVFFLSFIVYFMIKKMVTVKPRFNLVIIKGLLGLGLIYAVTAMISILSYRVDIILLERYSNSYELGIYSKGAIFVELLWQIPTVLSTVTFSRSAAAKDSREFSLKVCSLLRFAGTLIIILSVVFYFIAHFVIGLMYGKAFYGSAEVIKILLPGVVLMTIYKVLYMDIAGRGKPWKSIEAMLPAVIVNVFLNIWWIPKYGANGSALASTVSYSMAAIIFMFIYSRHTDISIKRMFAFSGEDKEFISKIVMKFKRKQQSNG